MTGQQNEPQEKRTEVRQQPEKTGTKVKRLLVRNSVQTEEEGSGDGSGKKAVAVGIAALLILLLFYMVYFPLPIYEQAEDMVRNASSPADIDYSLLDDPDAVSAEHNKLIKQTQQWYTRRRDEIVEAIKSGPITDKAIQICNDMVASGEYGPTAQFGSFEWYIPESAECLDLTLSAEEADKLLYLYSCLYDMDFMNGTSTTFEGWFFGVDGMKAVYPVKAFGDTYYISGRGGYCMNMDTLNEAREEAAKNAKKAVQEEQKKRLESVIGNPLMASIVSFLCRSFVTVADASDTDTYKEAYAATMQEYYSEYGYAACDIAIYTGISDQINGEITFSFSGTPSSVWETAYNDNPQMWHGTIETYDKDKEAQGVVAMYNSMPFLGRLVTMVEDDVQHLSSDYSYYWEDSYSPVYGKGSEAYYKSNGYSYYYSGGIMYVNKPVEKVKSIQTHTKHTYYLSILVYDCTEFVDFVGKANINASGLADMVKAFINIADNEIGTRGGYKYSNGRYEAWCADFVSWCAREAGLVDAGLLPSAAGVSYYYGVLTSPTDFIVSDGKTYGMGYPSYDISELSQFSSEGTYTAVPGDIVFFNGNKHIGIVTAVTDNMISVTQGNIGSSENASAKVDRVDYDTEFVGRIVHPDYPQAELLMEYSKGEEFK